MCGKSKEDSRMKFLIFFVHQHLDFRIQELASVLLLRNLISTECIAYDEIDVKSPVLEIFLPSIEDAKFISQRCILVKGVYQIWGSGNDYPSLLISVEEFPQEEKAPYLAEESSWRIDVEAFGKKYSQEEQHNRRIQFRHVLPFRGPAKMKDPSQTFLVLEEIGLCGNQEPKCIYFLRKIAGGAKNRGRGGGRDLVDKQTLKKRVYIGPTSMDNEMSLIMANMGLVDETSMVLDPFVGTGSLLVAAATFGAFCVGTDIDHRIIYGKNGVNVNSNFEQYKLTLPELVRCDNSLPPFLFEPFYDAIICDPPYGIRAGARKSGCTYETPPSYVSQYQNPHIARTQIYEAEDVMKDLLDFAAKVLVVGGRLVYLLPTTYDYTDDDLPCHPCLQVIYNSEQPLSKKYARRLITMTKIEPYDPLKASAGYYGNKTQGFSFAKLREKIIQANRDRNRSKRNKLEEHNRQNEISLE